MLTDIFSLATKLFQKEYNTFSEMFSLATKNISEGMQYIC